jgi:hypothetical protein
VKLFARLLAGEPAIGYAITDNGADILLGVGRVGVSPLLPDSYPIVIAE